MKKTIFVLLLALTFVGSSFAQKSSDPAFDLMMNDLIDFSVPIITCEQLKSLDRDKLFLLDARELEEFKVSHIDGAKHVGFTNFSKKALDGVPKNKVVVVYCSVGYRSEKISEQLLDMGYKNVYNLYGSIFEWINLGFPVVDDEGEETEKVHAFDDNWGQWLRKGIKVY